MYLGIDLGGINVAAGLVNDHGKIVSRRSVPTPRTPDAVADAICGKGTFTFEKIGINDEFGQSGKPPVLFEAYGLTDAGCAALGEYIAGAGRGSSSMVVITLGTGIGGGAVLNGKLYTGLNHAGLEVGHLAIEHGGRLCTCGRRGCFETYCSATALIREARRAMEQTPDSLLWTLAGGKEKVNGKLIFDAYGQGDPTARTVVEEFLSYLGDGVVSLVNIFQPEVFAIGGGLAGAGEAILGPVREILDREDYARGSSKRTRLVKAKLGNDAGIIGAAVLGRMG